MARGRARAARVRAWMTCARSSARATSASRSRRSRPGRGVPGAWMNERAGRAERAPLPDAPDLVSRNRHPPGRSPGSLPPAVRPAAPSSRSRGAGRRPGASSLLTRRRTLARARACHRRIRRAKKVDDVAPRALVASRPCSLSNRRTPTSSRTGSRGSWPCSASGWPSCRASSARAPDAPLRRLLRRPPDSLPPRRPPLISAGFLAAVGQPSSLARMLLHMSGREPAAGREPGP